jgi:hypothetical protein
MELCAPLCLIHPCYTGQGGCQFFLNDLVEDEYMEDFE